MKKTLKLERESVREVLHRFYNVIDDVGNPIPEEDFIKLDYDSLDYEVETGEEHLHDRIFITNQFIETLQEMLTKYKNDYDSIEMQTMHSYDDGPNWGWAIVGYRKETDSEYNARVAQHKKALEQKVKRAKQAQERRKAKDLKQLAKLKSKYKT